MKIKLDSIIGIAGLVGGLVKIVQRKMPGRAGKSKASVVIEQVGELLPIVEGITGKDIVDNAKWTETLARLISAEKAVMVANAEVQDAREAFAALVADIKAKAKDKS